MQRGTSDQEPEIIFQIIFREQWMFRGQQKAYILTGAETRERVFNWTKQDSLKWLIGGKTSGRVLGLGLQHYPRNLQVLNLSWGQRHGHQNMETQD